MYTSDKWIIIKVDDAYRVFATTGGDYIHGESWRINSGITHIDDKKKHYYIHGESGSVYKCKKKSYGVTGGYNTNVLTSLTRAGAKVLEKDGEWRDLIES